MPLGWIPKNPAEAFVRIELYYYLEEKLNLRMRDVVNQCVIRDVRKPHRLLSTGGMEFYVGLHAEPKYSFKKGVTGYGY
jgi:hypothetical protein